ncbi:MAG: cobyrinate a,c-diamide synthase [Nitrospiraceae bacterium]|nr:cobyrinate a,c-diamide synthase [Nitrospiraceae bacterium]
MLVIPGTHSGCGKSTVTLGVLSALKRMGHTVQPFKAGPDFIDPGLHGMITGRASRNLDIWMCGRDYVLRCVKKHSAGADSAVVEGVMGLYDGAERSTAALAGTLGANIILVVDAYGMAESAGAVVKGFCSYGQEKIKISGVIFNRVSSKSHYERLRASVKNAEVLGFLPRDAGFSIPERHLGLYVAEEDPLGGAGLGRLTQMVLDNVDMEAVYRLSQVDPGAGDPPRTAGGGLRIGVARDKAFCFYYEDNLDMLRVEGAETVSFSPLLDERLPDGIDALYLGGGYPELHAGMLAKNSPMRESIRNCIEEGMPVYAECGGLMYLGEGININGEFYPMCGVFPFRALMRERPVLGYRELTVPHACVLGERGDVLRGHEFHYSEVEKNPVETESVKYNVFGERDRICSASYKSALASYTHVHFGSKPDTAVKFIQFIKGRRKIPWR